MENLALLRSVSPIQFSLTISVTLSDIEQLERMDYGMLLSVFMKISGLQYCPGDLMDMLIAIFDHRVGTSLRP